MAMAIEAVQHDSGAAGACQRVQAHLQLHLTALTVLLAAAWAVILQAAQAIASGLHHQKEAAKAHLLLLKQSSPSRLYRRSRAARGAQQQPCITSASAVEQQDSTTADKPSTGSRPRRRRSQHSPAPVHQCFSQQQQHCAAGSTELVPCSSRVGAQGQCRAVRIPMQLQEHRGRLTIALDLDETLLCTYRIEPHPSQRDTLQLVPSSYAAGLAHAGSSSGSGVLSRLSALSWPLLSSKSRASGSGSADSSSSTGSYRVSTSCEGLPGGLGAAARAAAWMHYVPPQPSSARRVSTSSSDSGSISSLSDPSTPQQQTHLSAPAQQQQHQHPPGLQHVLAVFLRPGCREFLAQLSSFAEVVLFTAAAPEYGAPLCDLLDPQGLLFRGRLYGDACTHLAGRRGVKDLQVLGRDVRRVVLVDNCLFSFLAQPRNGLPVLPFRGGDTDSQLLGVILPLLRSLSGVAGDIRPLLDSMFRVRHWLASKGYRLQAEEDGAEA